MNKDYVGYSLFDRVIIVAKNIIERYDWKDRMCTPVFSDRWQGYVVDPSNKSMLKSALEWGRQTKSIYVDGKYSHNEVIEPQQFEFENKGWRMEILRTADGSSQGGKLSFWTCKVSKDGHTFEVGINADLLLDIIKSQTLVNGSCDKEFMFARCKGGVGLLCEDMPEYKQALADMQKKQDVKSKKTSKHVLGHAYSALQEVQAYVADLYLWYKPILETYKPNYWSSYSYDRRIVGYRKLEKPKKFLWFPTLYNFEPGKMYKLSSCLPQAGDKPFAWVPERLFISYRDLREKLPARVDAGESIEYDLPLETVITQYNEREIIRDIQEALAKDKSADGCYPLSTFDLVGLSANPDSYELPPDVRAAILSTDLRIED